MRLAHDAGDLLLRSGHLARGERAGENVPDVHIAAQAALRGGVRHENDVVLVRAAGVLSLGLHDADDRERHVADPDLHADRVAPGEQVLRHGGAEERDLAPRPDVRVREELARARAPVANREVIQRHAIDPRAPVALPADHLRQRHHHRRHRRHQRRLPLDLLGVGDGELVVRSRALTRAALRARRRHDEDDIRAQTVDGGLDLLARAVAEGDHHDDGANADHDAKHRQQRPHLVLADALPRHLEQRRLLHAASRETG